MGAVRLPNKPLHLIGDKTLLGHVLSSIKKNYQGRVMVACCEDEVSREAAAYGIESVMTDATLASGSDRVYQAYLQCGKEYDYIINLQGDMAVFPEELINKTLDVFNHLDVDVATAVSSMDPEDINNPSCVKAAFEPLKENGNFGSVIYFSRQAIPHEAPKYYKHLGIYAYKTKALAQFVSSPITYLESAEKLEQLRALCAGQKFGAAIVEGHCLSVDTLDDVRQVKNLLGTY